MKPLNLILVLKIFQQRQQRSNWGFNCGPSKHSPWKTWNRIGLLLLLKHFSWATEKSLWWTVQVLLWSVFPWAAKLGRHFWAMLHSWRTEGWLWRLLCIWIHHGMHALTGYFFNGVNFLSVFFRDSIIACKSRQSRQTKIYLLRQPAVAAIHLPLLLPRFPRNTTEAI